MIGSDAGHQRLWGWFGLSRASFLTLPRAMMHDMPDEWQAKMADLLKEWDEQWPNFPDVELSATCREGGRLRSMPKDWLSYRHVSPGTFDKYREQRS
ncbi:MAG: hypothetical protein AAGC81_02455 [Pseudomonadota bacterium]